MVNYNNGKIYKIESHLGDKVYIGSTTKEYLSQRMTTHREGYNRWKQGKKELTTSFLLFDEYGIENCLIVLLELCPCESKDQLHAREACYIRTVTCVNKCIPLRTPKEYNDDNKEQHKEYYHENKERILKRLSNYRANNLDKINEQKVSYRKENRERINKKSNEFYQANKDEINRKRREKAAAKKLELQQSVQ
jgi:hypothetical protein